MLRTVVRLKLVTLGAIALAITCACGAVTTPATGSTLNLGVADAGRTVQVKVGDTVRLTLEENRPVPGSSLVWDATSSSETVLARVAVVRSSPVASGPGTHNTYSADFRAIAAGQAVLDAHGATSCEAMAKANCPDRDFNIAIVVAT